MFTQRQKTVDIRACDERRRKRDGKERKREKTDIKGREGDEGKTEGRGEELNGGRGEGKRGGWEGRSGSDMEEAAIQHVAGGAGEGEGGGGGKGKPRGDRQEEKGRKFVIVLWSFFHYALFIYVSISP